MIHTCIRDSCVRVYIYVTEIDRRAQDPIAISLSLSRSFSLARVTMRNVQPIALRQYTHVCVTHLAPRARVRIYVRGRDQCFSHLKREIFHVSAHAFKIRQLYIQILYGKNTNKITMKSVIGINFLNQGHFFIPIFLYQIS